MAALLRGWEVQPAHKWPSTTPVLSTHRGEACFGQHAGHGVHAALQQRLHLVLEQRTADLHEQVLRSRKQ